MMNRVMAASQEQRFDFLVAGAGIAGLRGAIELASAGSVLVLTKNTMAPGRNAEGPSKTASPLADVADTGEHELAVSAEDVIRNGEGLCREEAARALADEAPAELKRLSSWGAHLPEAARPAGSGARRLRHLPSSPPAGFEMQRALAGKAATLPGLQIRSRTTVMDLILEDGAAAGLTYLDGTDCCTARARAVLIATGGVGAVYAETTNPPGSSGDGVAAAFRAGAALSDLEFIQFYPTALCSRQEPRLPLSHALRERGAVLRNLELSRFMGHYHEAAELAPPDVLARAIISEMQRGRSEFVYLDLTALDSDQVKRDFPRLFAAVLECSIDMTSDLVPVRPAAHFIAGGIATRADGAATLPGLFAAGEAAAWGAHGANPEAGRALVEALVSGARAARAMIRGAPPAAFFPPRPASSPSASSLARPASDAEGPRATAAEIRRLMWQRAGVIRHGGKLKEAIHSLNALTAPRPHPPVRQSLELENLLLIARLVALCADGRKESRGAHYRADFPLRDDSKFAKHSFVSEKSGVYFA